MPNSRHISAPGIRPDRRHTGPARDHHLLTSRSARSYFPGHPQPRSFVAQVSPRAGRPGRTMSHAHAAAPQAAASAGRRVRRGTLVLSALGVAALAPAGLAAAAPSVPDGFTITSFSAPPATSPATVGADDVARLDGHDFVGFNDGVPKTGPAATGPQNSTVVEYNDDGTIANTFSVRGRVDGLGADPANHRVIVTTNEDGNSTFHTLDPTAAVPVVDYAYSPNPPRARTRSTTTRRTPAAAPTRSRSSTARSTYRRQTRTTAPLNRTPIRRPPPPSW